MLSIAGPVLLAEELASEKDCLALAKIHKERFISEQRKVPQMYCVGVQEIGKPPMEIPGKHI